MTYTANCEFPMSAGRMGVRHDHKPAVAVGVSENYGPGTLLCATHERNQRKAIATGGGNGNPYPRFDSIRAITPEDIEERRARSEERRAARDADVLAHADRVFADAWKPEPDFEVGEPEYEDRFGGSKRVVIPVRAVGVDERAARHYADQSAIVEGPRPDERGRFVPGRIAMTGTVFGRPKFLRATAQAFLKATEVLERLDAEAREANDAATR